MSGPRIDLATLLQLAVPLAAVAVAWGNSAAKLEAQRDALNGLERAILAERAERLSEQAQQAQQRMVWLLARSGQRLDPNISDVVKSATR